MTYVVGIGDVIYMDGMKDEIYAVGNGRHDYVLNGMYDLNATALILFVGRIKVLIPYLAFCWKNSAHRDFHPRHQIPILIHLESRMGNNITNNRKE